MGAVLFGLYICASICAIETLLRIVKMKGHHKENKVLLCFIGLFATPICLGLIVCALPDRGRENPDCGDLGGSLQSPAVAKAAFPAKASSVSASKIRKITGYRLGLLVGQDEDGDVAIGANVQDFKDFPKL